MQNWTDDELAACVVAYFQMLNQSGRINKSAINRQLRESSVAKRSRAAIEYRMQNISATLEDLDIEPLKGYLPARNVGSTVKIRIRKILIENGLIKPSWRQEVEFAFNNIGGVAHLSDVYSFIENHAERSLPTNWKSIVRKEIEHGSSDSKHYQKKSDKFYSVNGIGEGFWGLRKKEPKTPVAPDSFGSETPERKHERINRIIRDSKLTRYLKRLHDNRCQICSDTIVLPSGAKYSEAHHIKPVGGKHAGPDIADNVVVLCPNHHVMCDYGVIELSLDQLTTHPGHNIDPEYILYHNDTIVGR